MEERNYGPAENAFKEALVYNEKNIDAYILLGDVRYYAQRLPEAKEYWQKAARLNPDSELVTERLRRLEQQSSIEEEFKSKDYWSFKIAFEDSLKTVDSSRLRSLLWEAYRKVGQDFNYFPESKIIILFYPHDEYMKMTGYGTAVKGHYDGKIRIPILENAEQLKTYRPTVWHEYTHAIIHVLCPEGLPLWLNEGLAVYEENEAKPLEFDRLKDALEKDALIPINQLDQALTSLDNPRIVNLAYQEAFSLAEYIISRYSFWHVKNILIKVGEKRGDFDNALREVLYTSLERLEKDWRNYIEKKYD